MRTSLLTLGLVAVTALASPAATFTVTTTADSGPGSLRQAILDANANPGFDTIAFAIGSGVQPIMPLSHLPTITDPVLIDGGTQPGFTSGPLVELDGSKAGANTDGLIITAGFSTVRGLVISGFSRSGIVMQDGGENRIEACFIGIDRSGQIKQPNAIDGISIISSSGNLIGGTNLDTRNTISGNINHGIHIHSQSTSNRIQGNIIGLDVHGTNAIGNGFRGINIIGCTNNLVGGLEPGAGNVISANGLAGVLIDTGATGNRIEGNHIGTLSTAPNTSPFIIELFANDASDSSGYGEGQTFLGSTVVGTDVQGDASFSVMLPTNVPAGRFITATTTGASGSTSEFSACLRVEAPQLNVSRTAVGIAYSWPGWATGCQLMQATDLNPPIMWTSVNNLPVPAGKDLTVTVIPQGKSCFFTLTNALEHAAQPLDGGATR